MDHLELARISVEVDYDSLYDDLIASLPGLSNSARLVMNTPPNWCILRHSALPRGKTAVDIVLFCRNGRMSALEQMRSHRLRPVFFPEFAAVLNQASVRDDKLLCLGSLWTNRGYKYVLLWEKGTIQICSHRTPFLGPEFFFPAVCYNNSSTLMKVPL